MKSVFYVLMGFSCAILMAQKPMEKIKSKHWTPLIDDNLSKWEVWTGVPEPSVKNLPSSYVIPDHGKPIKPLGLGDPMKIYTVERDVDGEWVIHISGVIYAGLTSLENYSNYHLTLLFKWGEKKYVPRLDRKRDSGLLYHCHGDHGALWKVWKSCLEMQIQEGDMGDLYALAGTNATVRQNDSNTWDPTAPNLKLTKKTTKRSFDNESPHGEWTRLDLYVVNDKAIHMVNGKVVLALEDALSKSGKPLLEGQIQIQSEGAEAFLKDIAIRPLKRFPKKLRKAAGFQ